MHNIKENEILQNKINIQYRMPKLFNRVLANLVDIIIFALLFFGFYAGTRAIVKETKVYKEAREAYEQACIDSGLYRVNDKGVIIDLVTYITNDSTFSGKGKRKASEQAISDFYDVYLPTIVDDETYQTLLTKKDDYFLDASRKPKEDDIQDIPFFVMSNEGVIPNPELENFPGIDTMYYAECYKPFIDKVCLRQFQSYSPAYRHNFNTVANLILFVVVPVSYVSSAILTWFVPPLFFRKGRKTLGKALYHIGLIQSDFYNCKFSKWLIRFVIFFFGEMILSIATLGIPFIISISMMVFSKHKQGFPDYMLGLYEVDTSNNKIYNNEAEITLDHANTYKEPIDFKMEDLPY